jgi:hypothetical protein
MGNEVLKVLLNGSTAYLFEGKFSAPAITEFKPQPHCKHSMTNDAGLLNTRPSCEEFSKLVLSQVSHCCT